VWCNGLECDRTWDLSGANCAVATSAGTTGKQLEMPRQCATKWPGPWHHLGCKKGLDNRRTWDLSGAMRCRYFSRYNRQAIGDTSAMLNKMAGTVASSGERSVATALNTSGKLLEIPLQCSRKWPGMMVAPSGVQWGLDNERSRLLPRVNAPPLQTLTQPASIRRCLCEAYKRCREKRLLVSLRARKPGRMA
jgi:hypothetical protein